MDSHWHSHRCLHHLSLLCHRTVSATIPSTQPILRRPSTTEAIVFEDSTGHASRAEYELSRMRSRSKSSRASRFTTTKACGRRSQRSQSQNAIARMEESLCAKSNWIQIATQSAVHISYEPGFSQFGKQRKPAYNNSQRFQLDGRPRRERCSACSISLYVHHNA